MSLNDPRWGNQGNDDKRGDRNRDDNQGPPDLEDVWRDFNQRLAGMFGGKRRGGGSGGPQMPQLSSKEFSGGIWALIILAFIIWLASGFYTIDAYQRGVVLRFGQLREITDPGWHWRLPYPIESHEKVDLTGVRVVEVGYRNSDNNKMPREALMLTDDENIINIQFAVQYILKSPEDYLFNNRDPDESVRQAAETSMREIVGKSKMDFVLYEGREQIAATAQELMQRILDRYQTGILISRVTMQNAQPPEQVQAAFDDAVRAGQDRERQRNEGEAYANGVVPIAKGRAARILEEANGYRARVVARAEGDASRFDQIYAEFVNAPEVTRERLYLEVMQQMLSNSSKVLIDADNGGNLLLMPLDKLLQRDTTNKGGQNDSSSASLTAPISSTPAPAPQNQSTPLLDSRDREALRNRGGR